MHTSPTSLHVPSRVTSQEARLEIEDVLATGRDPILPPYVRPTEVRRTAPFKVVVEIFSPEMTAHLRPGTKDRIQWD